MDFSTTVNDQLRGALYNMYYLKPIRYNIICVKTAVYNFFSLQVLGLNCQLVYSVRKAPLSQQDHIYKGVRQRISSDNIFRRIGKILLSLVLEFGSNTSTPLKNLRNCSSIT